jgi:two-component sensor histidine kinase
MNADYRRPQNEATAAIAPASTSGDELKEESGHIKLLLREVNHRANNLLSVVQAMARLMDRGDNQEVFAEKLCERVSGLASSHDLLASSEWRGIDTKELARRQMGYFRDRIGSRIVLDGPPVKLRPFAAQAIGLALHELVINAAEHGALSAERGTVRLVWNVAGDRSELLFMMKWSESGGPLVKAPAHSGFGHRVLCEMTRYALDAVTVVDYAPAGLVWQLIAPAERTLDKSGAAYR